MIRQINRHIVEGDSANHQLTIQTVDPPGAGAANHCYEISGFNTTSNPSGEYTYISCGNGVAILFQNGPIPEVGVNGVTNEALLAIVADRLNAFQCGPFGCRENEEALAAVWTAIDRLQERTRKRLARGVEGTHAV